MKYNILLLESILAVPLKDSDVLNVGPVVDSVAFSVVDDRQGVAMLGSGTRPPDQESPVGFASQVLFGHRAFDIIQVPGGRVVMGQQFRLVACKWVKEMNIGTV